MTANNTGGSHDEATGLSRGRHGRRIRRLQRGHVLAQDYPSKPVRILVSTAPGGMADTLGRLLASHLTQVMGQQFYVENRGGAGNIIGIDVVAKSPPDGYTLLVCAGTITINHIMYKKLPYDVLRDLAPITQLVSLPNVLVVHPSQPYQDARGVHRGRQGEARPDQLRLGRRRQQSASVDGAPEGHDRHRRRARALQGRRPGDVRPVGRARGRRWCPTWRRPSRMSTAASCARSA